MRDPLVTVLQEYVNDCLFEPSNTWPEIEFARRTYSRWAADEIANRLNENHDPIAILEQFIDEMDDYSEVTDDKETQFIFTVAKETAEDIALLFV